MNTHIVIEIPVEDRLVRSYALPEAIREWCKEQNLYSSWQDAQDNTDKKGIIVRYSTRCKDKDILLLIKLKFSDYKSYFVDWSPKKIVNGEIVNAFGR